MKNLALKRYQKIEGHDSTLTTEDILEVRSSTRTDFIKRVPTKIDGTLLEVLVLEEVKTWYELGDYEFLATKTTYRNKVTRTIEISGVV